MLAITNLATYSTITLDSYAQPAIITIKGLGLTGPITRGNQMIAINEINSASTSEELIDMVEAAAFERNCELDASLTYEEQAQFLTEEAANGGNGHEQLEELAGLLEAAEIKWHALES